MQHSLILVGILNLLQRDSNQVISQIISNREKHSVVLCTASLLATMLTIQLMGLQNLGHWSVRQPVATGLDAGNRRRDCNRD